MMAKLPIWPTVVEAYAFVWRERKDFASLAFPAIVVLAIVGTLVAWLAKPMTATGSGDDKGTIGPESAADFDFGALISFATYLVLWAMFAVAWHRRYLVPDEVATVRAALRWGRRQTRFLLIVIGLTVLIVVLIVIGAFVLATLISLVAVTLAVQEPALVTGVFGGIGGWLLLIVLLFPIGLVYARLSMLFPSTAVDHRMSFGECWKFTRGNGWRLLFIISLVGIPVGLIASLLTLLVTRTVADFGLGHTLTANFIVGLVGQAFAFISIAVGVSALSVAYRELMSGRRQASPAEG